MTDLDPDIDWVALLEAQGAGPEKYHAHSNAHAMACQKYTVAAQQAKSTGNHERAKLLRKIGKKHKEVAAALADIANHHVGATYSIHMKKKAELMPKKKQPVTEEKIEVEEVTLDEETVAALDELADNGVLEQYFQMHVQGEAEDLDEDAIEEDEISPVRTLIGFALTESPLDFQTTVHDILGELVSAQLAELKDRLQEALASQSDGSDEDSEDESEESPEIQGESYRYATTEPGPEGHGTKPAMGQEKLSEPAGKKFPAGRQDVDAHKLPKIGSKKKSQKGTTVAAGDTERTQRAAD